jgi:hypothetical protein
LTAVAWFDDPVHHKRWPLSLARLVGEEARRCAELAIGSMNKIMPAFTILEPPAYQHTAIEHAERFIFLPEKFYLAAFLFAPLWMIWRRLWVVLIIYLVGVGLIAYGLRLLGINWIAVALVFGLIHLLVGLDATSLVRWTRFRHGWRECGIVIADDLDMAERRFFDNRTAPRAPARPGCVPAAGPAPAAQTGNPDIIGLFPEPGGGR